MKKNAHYNFVDALHNAGLRATPHRIEVLSMLSTLKKPVSVETLKKKMPASDTVTLYRTLEAFSEQGLANRVDLRHGHQHYESVLGMPHHHHMVCTACGHVEDVEWCPVERAKNIQSKFKRVTSHSLEFFGVCTSCA